MADSKGVAGGKLVSVVVPAYNAEDFIGRTLASVMAQSHQKFEVIVVDDGSTDQTASIVKRYIEADQRIRLIRQANRGVAAARNAGIRESRGAFIAPVDADDLWHPSKLEKQLRVFAKTGSDTGLVYTLYRTIDADDQVISSSPAQRPEGWVFLQHLKQNFIGHGSSLLIRRSIVEAAGGYSSRLRRQGAEGCEDFFLQLNIATKCRFGVLPEFLVGYRRTEGNMSSNVLGMKLSRRLVLESFLERCSTAVKPVLLDAIQQNDFEILRLGIKSGRCRAVAGALARIIKQPRVPLFAQLPRKFWSIFIQELKDGTKRTRYKTSNTETRKCYWEYSPTEGIGARESPEFQTATAELARIDSKIGPAKGYLIQAPERGNLGETGDGLVSSVCHMRVAS